MDSRGRCLTLFLIILSLSPSAMSQLEADYPNPRNQPKNCNRQAQSYICDPDAVLTTKQVEKLDSLATEMTSSATCLCSKCLGPNSGATIGILIRHNVTQQSNNMTLQDLTELAQIIRANWRLGACGDDIIIIVLTQTRQAAVDIGPAIERAISKKLARQIFDDCIGHFDNDHFYQGLESMVNSYRDVLKRIDMPKPKDPPSKRGLIVGLSLGIATLVTILVAAALIKFRQVKQMQQRNARLPASSDMAYRLCAPEDREKNGDGCSSSDEGIDSDEELKIFEAPKSHIPKFQDVFHRQLSDIIEENEELAALRFAMNNNPKNMKTHVTEL